LNEDLEFLLRRRGSGVLLDANLLLVYVVGKTDRRCLLNFAHTSQYQGDYALIERIVEMFPRIYTTPNVLTEVSNLGGKLEWPLRGKFFDTLHKIIGVLDEMTCASKQASASACFRRFGLTDAVLFSLAIKHLVVTTDARLHELLRENKLESVNIHHLRQLAWKGFLRL
jgi:rRNA-processing protein FCF1